MSWKPVTGTLDDYLRMEVFSTLHMMFFTHISHPTSLDLVFFPRRQNRPELAPVISKPAFSGPPDVLLYIPTEVSAFVYLHPHWTLPISQFHKRLH